MRNLISDHRPSPASCGTAEHLLPKYSDHNLIRGHNQKDGMPPAWVQPETSTLLLAPMLKQGRKLSVLFL